MGFCLIGGINAVNSDGWRTWCGLVGGLGAAWLEAHWILDFSFFYSWAVVSASGAEEEASMLVAAGQLSEGAVWPLSRD